MTSLMKNNIEIINRKMIMDSIKHFESLQKRYVKQHNNKQCQFVKTALFSLYESLEKER